MKAEILLPLWIVVGLLTVRIFQTWIQLRRRSEEACLAYAAQRMHTRAVADLATALSQTVPASQTVLSSIGKRLSDVLRKEEQILMELDDLNKAVADLQAASAAEITALNDIAAKLKALTGQSPIDPAAVEAAAQAIETVATNLAAATASVAPPAAPAAPAP